MSQESYLVVMSKRKPLQRKAYALKHKETGLFLYSFERHGTQYSLEVFPTFKKKKHAWNQVISKNHFKVEEWEVMEFEF